MIKEKCIFDRSNHELFVEEEQKMKYFNFVFKIILV